MAFAHCPKCGSEMHRHLPLNEGKPWCSNPFCRNDMALIAELNALGSRWKKQWYVKGSAKLPYIVSLDKAGDWHCSCPAWTRNMPREDCKHILRVKLETSATAIANNLKPVVSIPAPSSQLFSTKGRKFR